MAKADLIMFFYIDNGVRDLDGRKTSVCVQAAFLLFLLCLKKKSLYKVFITAFFLFFSLS